MANINQEIAAIESAARGEEVRDSIISALQKMNSGLNYIIPCAITIDTDALVADSSAYSGGYRYDYTKAGIKTDTFAEICLTDLGSFVGRYAVQTVADGFKIYLDHMPNADLNVIVYYFEDAEYGIAEQMTF